MKKKVLSSLGKMQLNLGQASFIGLLINKSGDSLNLALLLMGIAFTISACIFIALSAKDEDSHSSRYLRKHKIRIPKNTTIGVEVEQ